MKSGRYNALIDVTGIRVGHHTAVGNGFLTGTTVLDVVVQLNEPRCQRRRNACLSPERHHDAELCVDFRAPLPHGEIPPDAAVGLGRAAVECDEIVE